MTISHPRRGRYPLLAVGVLVWVTLVLGLYYWVHKPITPALARAVGGAALDIASNLVILAAAAGLGRKLLARTLDRAFWSTAERIAADGLVGLSVLSLVLVLLGTVTLNAVSVAALLGVVIALAFREVLSWAGDLRGWLAQGLPADRWARFLALIVALVLAIALVLALLPPTKWDVLTYHLAGAEQYVARGHFYAAEHNHFLGFPQLVDTLFAANLALTGQLTGPAVLHWLVGVLALMAVGGYAARRAGQPAGWVAAGVLLAGKSIWLEMTFAYVDLMPIGLAVVALSLIERWHVVRHVDTATPARRRQAWRYLMLAGALAGFALGVKYSVLWLALGLGVPVLWWGRRDGLRALAGYGVVYGLAALAVFAPWLIRNAAWYGNPVYPFMFSSAEMDTIRQSWYGQPRSGLIYSADRWQVPVLPLSATILGVEGAGTYGTDIGPLYLILLPLLALAWGSLETDTRRTLRFALSVAGVILAAWWLSATFGSYISLQTRLVLYLFGPLAIACGIALEGLRRLPKKPFDLYFVLRALVGVTFVFTAIDALQFLNTSGAGIYFGGKSDHEKRYLEHALGWHYATMQRVNTLPAGETVRFLWEPRYLYCDDVRLNCHTDSLMDAWYHARRTVAGGSPDAIAAAWRAEGADYLLVYEFGRTYEQEHATLYTAEDWDAWETFAREQLVEVWRTGNSTEAPQYILYRWRD